MSAIFLRLLLRGQWVFAEPVALDDEESGVLMLLHAVVGRLRPG